jgi:hypothetical protein
VLAGLYPEQTTSGQQRYGPDETGEQASVSALESLVGQFKNFLSRLSEKLKSLFHWSNGHRAASWPKLAVKAA